MVAAVVEQGTAGDVFTPPVAGLPQQMITEYVVTPDGYHDVHVPTKDRWTVRVRRTSMVADEWAVFDSTGNRVFSAVGVGWLWRKRISGSQFTAWCVMSNREAHRLALRIVSSLRVDGVPFHEMKRRAAERAAMPCQVYRLDLEHLVERDFDDIDELFFGDGEPSDGS